MIRQYRFQRGNLEQADKPRARHGRRSCASSRAQGVARPRPARVQSTVAACQGLVHWHYCQFLTAKKVGLSAERFGGRIAVIRGCATLVAQGVVGPRRTRVVLYCRRYDVQTYRASRPAAISARALHGGEMAADVQQCGQCRHAASRRLLVLLPVPGRGLFPQIWWWLRPPEWLSEDIQASLFNRKRLAFYSDSPSSSLPRPAPFPFPSS